MARPPDSRGALSLGTVLVAGDSMSPTYLEGDWLVVRWNSDIKLGQVVVVERNERPGIFLIKRCLREESGKFWVEGDNISSTDSREWGLVDRAEIVGRVLLRIRRAQSHRGRR